MRRRSVLPVALAALAACSTQSGPALTIDGGGPSVGVAVVDFGAVLVDHEAVLELAVGNTGRTSGVLSATIGPGPFSVLSGSGEVLGAGSGGKLLLGFSPTVEGPAKGTLHLQVAGLSHTLDVDLAGLGGTPDLDADRSLDFGQVRVNGRASLTLHVHNRGVIPVTVAPMLGGSDRGYFQLGSPLVSLPPMSDGSLEVVFLPKIRGSVSAVVTLQPCPGCSTTQVTLAGEGADQALEATPSPRDFGEVGLGESLTRDVSLISTEEVSTWVSAITLVDGAGSPFSFQGPTTPFSLEGGHQLLHVTFAPTRTGVQKASIVVETSNGTAIIPLQGSATSTTIVANPATVDLGWIPENQPVVQRMHLSGDAVSVTAASLSGDPAYSTTMPPAPLLITSQFDFDLRLAATPFDPAGNNLHQASLLFDPGLPDQVTFGIPVSGEVVQGGSCFLSLQPTTLNLGAVAPGTTATATLVLSNQGPQVCTYGDVQIQGDGAFVLTSQPPPRATLDPGATQELQVEFTSAGAGLTSAVLQLRQASSMSPFLQAVLQADAAGSLSGSPLDLGQVAVSDRKLGSILLSNLAHAPARITQVVLDATSSAALTIAAPPESEIGPDGEDTVVIEVRPVAEGAIAGNLLVYQEGATDPLEVPISATTAASCGTSCPREPHIECPPPMAVPAFDFIHVNVATSSRFPLTGCQRTAVGPAPLPEFHPATSGCSYDALVGAPGTYLVDETARDTAGRTSTCRVELDVVPASALVIQAAVPGGDMVDLRLFHPSAGEPGVAGSWVDSPFICSHTNPAPDWDAAGGADDPVLHTGSGSLPTVIRVKAPSTAHPYTAGVRWSGAAGNEASIPVSTRVFCGGAPVVPLVTSLAHLFEAGPVLRIQPQDDGSCATDVLTGTFEVLP